MKIIGFGDIHMATAVAADIPEIKTADLLLLSGDLTNYGTAQDAKIVLDAMLRLNSNVLAQYGNLDNPEINDYLEDLGLNLHSQAHLIQREICIIGVGGSNYTPFRTPSEYSEKELFTLAEKAFKQGLEFASLAQGLHKRKIPLLLVSHVPPANTKVDRLYNGKHVGSTAIRTIIEKYQPDLCLTGHIHEGRGIDTIVNTPIYNPGMLRAGGWVSIDIVNSKLKVRLQ